MGDENSAGTERRIPRDGVVTALVLAWALPTGLFFFLRFSFVFYEAYRDPIQGLWTRLFGG
jgi:hypothetical protein